MIRDNPLFCGEIFKRIDREGRKAMQKYVLSSILILLITLLIFSFASAKKDSRVISPQVAALVVATKPAPDNPEINKQTNEPDTIIKQDNASDHFDLGVSYSDKGMYIEAVEAYKQALKMKPDYTEAHYNLGLSYYGLGMYKEAIDAYKQAAQEDNPDIAETHYKLALSYLMLEDKDSLTEEYKILRNLDSQKADNLYEAAIEKVSSDADSKYIIQVGAYKIPDNANKIFEKLKAEYIYAYVERETNFNKVRILGIKTKEEGALIIKEINNTFGLKPFLLSAH
ncbi:MAG TPA: tetratricopeptide repeat protein [Nitrospirae bacterium]|nr:photosystem I assembly protein Ycf3 [bacterium BMS3Abin06]HDH11915.1 tetratricopeptide repeat protein [Nitrospirota bacterium]HDZ02216.1 tetratricopeptide repeat protein [Nitrospirota bacterium]